MQLARLAQTPAADMVDSVWGIDIGGANIKLCRLDGQSLVCPFPMWTDHSQLGSTVAKLLQQLEHIPVADPAVGQRWTRESIMAVTMTGELADCFFSRREGVACILDGMTSVIPELQCRVYSVDGSWFTVERAKQAAWDVAASNWHALANWLLQLEQLQPNECHAIIDIGSTTVDIIPIHDRRVATSARTDRQRLQLGQLVYTGIERTPIHAIVQQLNVDGQACPVMAERFSTVIDAHLILGSMTEQLENCDTADGRPRTRSASLARLARMVGEDSETLGESTIEQLAEQVLESQCSQVAEALARNLPRFQSDQTWRPRQVWVSGHGRPLIDRLCRRPQFVDVQFVMLADLIGSMTSRCAPALAVAKLWQGFVQRSSEHA